MENKFAIPAVFSGELGNGMSVFIDRRKKGSKIRPSTRQQDLLSQFNKQYLADVFANGFSFRSTDTFIETLPLMDQCVALAEDENINARLNEIRARVIKMHQAHDFIEYPINVSQAADIVRELLTERPGATSLYVRNRVFQINSVIAAITGEELAPDKQVKLLRVLLKSSFDGTLKTF